MGQKVCDRLQIANHFYANLNLYITKSIFQFADQTLILLRAKLRWQKHVLQFYFEETSNFKFF